MTKEKHQTAAAEAARHIERINAAAAKIDPAQLDATLELLEALKEYVGTEAEALVYATLAATAAPQDHAAAATQKDQDAPDNAEGLRRIAETLRVQMPPEAAAQLVIEITEEMEAAAQQAGDSFKDLPPLDKLCLSCRESYIKGFVAACALAAQAYALPDDMKP